MFENPSTPGFIKVERLKKALTGYGTDKLTAEQASELISQVRILSTSIDGMYKLRISTIPKKMFDTRQL
jgi:hypothetical protein